MRSMMFQLPLPASENGASQYLDPSQRRRPIKLTRSGAGIILTICVLAVVSILGIFDGSDDFVVEYHEAIGTCSLAVSNALSSSRSLGDSESVSSSDDDVGVFFRVVESPSEDSSVDEAPEVLIEIVNGREEYAVTIESQGKYTGVASRVDSPENFGPQAWIFSWKPSFPGDYEVLVHEFAKDLGKRMSKQLAPKLILPSPLPISIRFKNVEVGGDEQSLNAMVKGASERVPCQSVDRMDVYSKWDGSWIGPDAVDGDFGNQIRTGWSFLPGQDMGCSIETFSRQELLSLKDRKSIYVLGSSIQRGVFLSMVDILLSKDEKLELGASIINKCWGRATVKKGNLDVTYIDFRSRLFEPLGSKNYVECHNGKMSKDPDGLFVNKAFDIWNELFEDENHWPSAILMDVYYNCNGQKSLGDPFFKHLQHFVETLPPSWDGTLIFSDEHLVAYKFTSRWQINYKRYLDQVKEMLASLGDRRIRWLDGVGLSKDMYMYSEPGKNGFGVSQHFHHTCSVPYEDEFESNLIRVCSNVTEVLGQVLFGHALGPKEEFMKEKLPTPIEAELEYCHACPRNLLPFQLVVRPDMTCASGALHEDTKDEFVDNSVFDTACPAWCLDQEVVQTKQSQSDTIYIRRCEIE